MKTAIAISAMMRNVFSVAKISPAIATASQMARIAPRIVPMIRPMYPVCACLPWEATVLPGAELTTAAEPDVALVEAEGRFTRLRPDQAGRMFGRLASPDAANPDVAHD